MPATDIADKAGLTPRRVRRILDQLIRSRALKFVARVNLNVGPGVTYYALIRWKEELADYSQILKWLDKEFPGVYYDSHVSVTAPMSLSLFAIDHLRDAEELSRRICLNPAIESVQTLFPFPAEKKKRLQRRKLEELIAEQS
jgi:hypothetical protein